ncbi:tol-pal system protein YbgF [Myxococcota bacterium]|jgi:tol-pal system protein YbgF|nr:tol-pal system protein YbgF [Myxococcota bacterium]
MRGIRTLLALASAALALSAAGCGGATAELRTQLTDQESRLRAMAEAYEAQNKRLEGLKGRVEVLEDQLEAAKLHGGAASRPLPVVKLAPPGTPAGGGEDEDQGGAEGGAIGYVISQDDVDAMDPERAAARRSGPRGPVPPPENAAFAGNIGVAPLPGGSGGAAAANTPPPVAEPTDEAIGAYKLAYAQYKNGDLAGAIAAFQRFAERYPEHSYSDNALFLVGRARFDRAELAGALTAFRAVVDRYPAGNKVPDALLMIGLTLDRLGRPAEGRETLSRLVSMFPGTDAATRAQATLRGGQM